MKRFNGLKELNENSRSGKKSGRVPSLDYTNSDTQVENVDENGRWNNGPAGRLTLTERMDTAAHRHSVIFWWAVPSL